MHDRDLYAKILGISDPWRVVDVELDVAAKSVSIFLEYEGSELPCPECGEAAARYDYRERRWRHLDTCQFQTLLIAKVPRSRCDQHGVKQISVPWATPGSRFTLLMETLVIDWLKHTANVTAVATMLGLTWDEVDGVITRAVRRGLLRKEPQLAENLNVDETSFQKRHEYVTVVSNRHGHVLHVADGRKRKDLEAFFDQFSAEERGRVESVAMDMWRPYIDATTAKIPNAERKIAFDKFHVAKHLGDAVDQVRRKEHRGLAADGDQRLAKSKYTWLRNPDSFTEEQRVRFEELRAQNLHTSKAWAMKETGMDIWSYRSRSWARRALNRWMDWVARSNVEPMKKVANMLRAHADGVVTAIVTGITNARAEGINSVIQWVKRSARGFRNRERFRNAIYFHLAGLDLYPAQTGK